MAKKTSYLLFMLCIALFLTGCSGRETATQIIERPGEPPVAMVERGDAEMAHAIAEAQKTLKTFIARVEKGPKKGEMFAVKVGLPTARGGHEHIWLAEVAYDKGEFSGIVDVEPVDLPNIKSGQQLKAKQADVSDW